MKNWNFRIKICGFDGGLPRSPLAISLMDLLGAETIELCRTQDIASNPSVIVVNASTKRWAGDDLFRKISEQNLENLRHKQAVLILDGSSEGHSVDDLDLPGLHGAARDYGVQPGSIMIASQNLLLGAQYSAFAESHSILPEDRFVIIWFHSWLLKLHNAVRHYDAVRDEIGVRRSKFLDMANGEGFRSPRSKKFLCLNFTPRPHRIYAVLHILAENLSSMGHMSFRGLDRHKAHSGSDSQALPEMVAQEARLLEQVPKLIELSPMTLDLSGDARPSVAALELGDYRFYEDSWFSLVTETNISGRKYRRFTEKIIKAILGFHPFLVLGTPFALQDLRDMGFKTFSPTIDEGYDQIQSTKRRMEKVLSEFTNMAVMPHSSLRKMYESVLTELLHNYDYFCDGIQLDFQKRMIDPFFDATNDIFSGSRSAALPVIYQPPTSEA